MGPNIVFTYSIVILQAICLSLVTNISYRVRFPIPYLCSVLNFENIINNFTFTFAEENLFSYMIN